MVHTTDISAVKRKQKIAELARDIRKKYLALKLGKSDEDEALEKIFKPISTPLKAVISTTVKVKREFKKELKKEEPSDIQTESNFADNSKTV